MKPAIIAGLLLLAHNDASWIQQSERFKYCCGPNDCARLPPDAVQLSDKTYIVQLPDGKVLLVPLARVLPSATEDFWLCLDPYGLERCFFAPPLGA